MKNYWKAAAKGSVVAFLICFFCFGAASAQNFAGKKKADINLEKPQKSFRVGETLRYSMQWLGIPVGTIVLKVNDLKMVRSRECYDISGNVYPNSFFKHFYNVEYDVHSFVDTQTFRPLRFEKTRRINDKYSHVVIDFYPDKLEAVYESQGTAEPVTFSAARSRLEEIKPETSKITANTQDLLSAFYYFRTLDITKNKSYSLDIYYDRRSWPIKMKVGEPFLRDIRKRGTLSMVKVVPDSELNDYILGKRNFSVFFSVDSYRVPVEFCLSTSFGSVCGIIQDIP